MKKLLITALLLLPGFTFAQWSTSGNALGSTGKLGTTNSQSVSFITNNVERWNFSSTGTWKIGALSGAGTGLFQLAADGTASRLNFSGNASDVLTGSGSFSPLSTVTGFSFDGTKITTSYKLGIGVANPVLKAEIDGSLGVTGTVYATNFIASDASMVQGQLSFTGNMFVNGYDAISGTRNEVYTSTQPYYIQSAAGYNNNTIINYNNTGMLGVGTNTPTAKLHVVGESKFDGNVTLNSFSIDSTIKIRSIEGTPKWAVFGPASTGPDVDPQLPTCFAPNVPLINAFHGLIHSYGNSAFGGMINSMTMGFDGANGIIDVAGTSSETGTPKLLINYFCGKDVAICTGNEGGIVSVGRFFEVNFPTRDSNIVANIAAQNKTALAVNSNHSTDWGYNTLLTVNRVNTKALIVHNSAISGGTGPEVFQVYGNGNTFINGILGVGTSCVPSGYKMGVDGYIICEGVNVKLANSTGCWPDYVFEKDYKLMSLKEIEAYIHQYKHLPDFPSAREVDEKGIDLAETNRILVQKMEELTLHLIMLEKEIEKLKENPNK